MSPERVADKAKPSKNINFNFLLSLIAYNTAKSTRGREFIGSDPNI